MVREVEKKDYKNILKIYNYYIDTTIISFEENKIDVEEISRRIAKVKSAGLWWLVIEKNEQVLGYCYASPWSQRSAYRYTVEVSIYLNYKETGKGYGRILYNELFRRLKSKTIHSAIGGIALPNPKSIKLHESFGMQKVAHYKEVGYKLGKWIDVGYWQVQLNT